MPLPMFPLGTVLFPTMVLPLHVFEPRYRELTEVCLEGDREFGVVLIERGSEVGGGDVRSTFGTIAQILEAQQAPDGRWALATVGTRRFRVLDWLADDPYPRAEVEDLPEGETGDALVERRARAEPLARRVSALRGELGESVGTIPADLADDPVLASYQLAAVSPVGTLDRQRLLGAANAAERFDALIELLADDEGYLRQRLAQGGR